MIDKDLKEIEDMSPEERQLNKAYQAVFLGSSEGQLVFWDLMDKGYVFRSFNQQNANAYALEGKRELALDIMHRVELSPDLGRSGFDRIRKSLEATAKFKEKEE